MSLFQGPKKNNATPAPRQNNEDAQAAQPTAGSSPYTERMARFKAMADDYNERRNAKFKKATPESAAVAKPALDAPVASPQAAIVSDLNTEPTLAASPETMVESALAAPNPKEEPTPIGGLNPNLPSKKEFLEAVGANKSKPTQPADTGPTKKDFLEAIGANKPGPAQPDTGPTKKDFLEAIGANKSKPPKPDTGPTKKDFLDSLKSPRKLDRQTNTSLENSQKSEADPAHPTTSLSPVRVTDQESSDPTTLKSESAENQDLEKADRVEGNVTAQFSAHTPPDANENSSTQKTVEPSAINNKENEPISFVFSYRGVNRTITISGNHAVIHDFSPNEAKDFASDPDYFKVIFKNMQMSPNKLFLMTLQPLLGDAFQVELVHNDGSTSTTMDVHFQLSEKPVNEPSLASSVGQPPSAEPLVRDDASNVPELLAPAENQLENETIETPELEPEPEKPVPTGPYWTHEWHVDRFGREAVFIWRVGGKSWYSNADHGYTYLRTMAAKVPGDEGYDPRFDRYKERPRIGAGSDPTLNFWFKKTPGWDNPNQKDDGTADFQDLAEFKDTPENKLRTGFYTMVYVFDPQIYEKLEAQRIQRQNATFIGLKTYYKAYVQAESGIILHETPTPDDPTYLKLSASKNKATHILPTNSPLIVIAEGNEENAGWVLVRAQSGEEGWIEQRYTAKKPIVQATNSFDVYTVKSGDTLEELIDSYYKKYPMATGNDRRTIALAIYLYNKNRPGSGVYRDASDYYQAKRTNALVDVFDYWTVETRANYASIKLYAGGEVVLPPAAFIAEMRRQGLLEKRPIMVDVLIDGGRTAQGFIYGVGFGFKDAIVSTGEDLYHLFLDIFTGEIFNQITDMFTLFMEKGLGGVWDMIKDFGVATWEELQAAWNNTNPYEQGKYFGEIVGAILFEVVLAIITYGIGTAIRQSARVAKIINWLPNLKNVKQIIPSTKNTYAVDLKKMNLDIEKKKLDVETKKLPEPAKVVETNKAVPESPKKIPTTKPLETEKPDLVEEKIASEKLPEKENVEGELAEAEMKDGELLGPQKGTGTESEIDELAKKDSNEPIEDDVNDSEADAAAKKQAMALAKDIVTAGDEGNLHPTEIMPALWALTVYKGVRGFSFVPLDEESFEIYLHGSKKRILPKDGEYDLGATDGYASNGETIIVSSRKEALKKAKERAGIPNSQQPKRQWQVGDDLSRKGQENYNYSSDKGSWGRYYEYETSNGNRVIVEHIADGKKHTHAGMPKDESMSDLKQFRYKQIDGKHHIYYE